MPEIDPRASELNHRWQLARAAALRLINGAERGGAESAAVEGGAAEGEAREGSGHSAQSDEAWLIALGMSAAPEALPRVVYDNGLKLGRSFARFHGGPLAGDALGELVAGLDSPCLRGRMNRSDDGGAWLLDRPACEDACASTCEFWREAFGGLLHGLTDGLQFVRHASGGTSAAVCRDVVHADPEGPWRFAALTPEVHEALEGARVALRMLAPTSPNLGTRFLGSLEGVIHYERPRSGCEPADDALAGEETFRHLLGRFVPGARFKDVSPRAVLAPSLEETAAH